MKLFGHPDSGHAYKVRLLLVTGGIEHDYEVVDIFSRRDTRSDEFQRNARFGEVPLLLDDGVAFTQSNAILLHLATRFSRWGAEDKQTLQLCREWLFWEANKIGMCLPQLRADRLFADSALRPDARAWLHGRYEHDVHVLDRQLAETGAFILGDAVSIADYSICAYLFLAEDAAVDVPANVTAWLVRMQGLAGWQAPAELLSEPPR